MVDWTETQGSLGLGRMFEYIKQPLVEQFSDNGQPAFDRLARLPCLLVNEGMGAVVCRAGTFTRTRVANPHNG